MQKKRASPSRPKRLSKSRLIDYLQCPRKLWLKVHMRNSEQGDHDPVSRFHAEKGQQVGEIAQSLYPKGVLIKGQAEGVSLTESLHQTQHELQRSRRRPLFEATFEHKGVLVRADLLIPERGGRWRLIEVKSSHNPKQHYYTDIAIQRYVLEQNGLTLSGVELAHINGNFVYKGMRNHSGLLTFVDVWDESDEYIDEIPSWVRQAQSTLSKRKPRVPSEPQCNKPYLCPFIDECFSEHNNDEHPLEDLYYKGKIVTQLYDEGYTDLSEVPVERAKKPEHRIHIQSIHEDRAVRRRILRDTVSNLAYPRYYLDFETASTPVPDWKNTRPHQQVPFQWSCHKESKSGKVDHFDFLHNKSSDPRPGFIKSLTSTLGKRGPILVYTNFERDRLRELQRDFPKWKEKIENIINRLVDLEAIVRGNYHHPSMRGSWSLKSVAPTIHPRFDYSDMEIGSGKIAAVSFFEMISLDTTKSRKEEIYQQLLKYCEMDTEVMVMMVRRFSKARW